jgi:hypothetical protein
MTQFTEAKPASRLRSSICMTMTLQDKDAAALKKSQAD